MTIEKITPEILRTWKPCEDGYKRFCKLLPDGGTLEDCINVLVENGHDNWGRWLFNKCIDKNIFTKTTSKGYRNTGDRNTGYWNTGDRNTGDFNTGYRNAGDRNTGDFNTGNYNTGDWNIGNWNVGNMNTGHFNTTTPKEINVFNKPCLRDVWNSAEKPSWLRFYVTTWIEHCNMTEDEKLQNPSYETTGGYLKEIPYQEAAKASWDKASKEDRELTFRLPNFDLEVFKEIFGFDPTDQ